MHHLLLRLVPPSQIVSFARQTDSRLYSFVRENFIPHRHWNQIQQLLALPLGFGGLTLLSMDCHSHMKVGALCADPTVQMDVVDMGAASNCHEVLDVTVT